jgi:hypothetical protein
MLYQVRCKKCGEYQVGSDFISAFLTPELKKKLEAADVEGKNVILNFHNRCPRCSPKNEDNVTLILRKRIRQE